MILAEALDALWTLGWAFLVWLVIAAAVATLALWTLFLAVYGAVTAVRRLLWPMSRRRPSWALTRAHSRSYARNLTDYDHAA